MTRNRGKTSSEGPPQRPQHPDTQQKLNQIAKRREQQPDETRGISSSSEALGAAITGLERQSNALSAAVRDVAHRFHLNEDTIITELRRRARTP